MRRIRKLHFIIFTVLCSKMCATNPCEIHKTCGDCVTDFHGCKWCSKENYTGSRCRPVSEALKKCDENSIENPISEILPTKNLDFESNFDKVIQIKPQNYTIKLRPGHTIDFDFYFKLAKDYPADMYFLVDASNSMKEVIKAIGKTALKIYGEMINNTRNVYLGVGTFIDKRTLPYTSPDKRSDYTYSYHNRLNLTKDAQKFKSVVENIPGGGNLDRAEGGFDGLAQVLACEDQVGWRKGSRKIIVFLTDVHYHSAGDGKWAGIVQPYDGKCYTVNNTYTKELDLDYPSISIINKLAMNLEATIVFGIKNEGTNLKVYKTLSGLLQGSRYFGYMENGKKEVVFNNSQIETILSTIYKDLTHNIKLRTIMTSQDRKYVNISLSPNCDGKVERNECKATYDEQKHFKGTIKLSEYYNKDKIPIEIIIDGLKEKLVLAVEVIKDCDCETNKTKLERDSKYCNGGGEKRCGICKCNANRYGDRCACSATNGSLADDSSCKAEGSTLLCSGRGSCFCGTCQCSPGFEGQFCQCNKINCPHQCSGHGKCTCGKCICSTGWSGEACDCSLAQCQVENDKECNGRGSCECGKCTCQPLEPWDARLLQTKSCKAIQSLDCQTEQCKLLQPCALCHFHNTPHCETICTNVNVTKLQKDYTKEEQNHKDQGWCDCNNFKVDVGCYSSFKYRYAENENRLDLHMLSEKDCVESYYVFGGSFLLGLLLIGLATLIIWKLLTDYRDLKEYERFVKQHTESENNAVTNPIYAPASVTYPNPAFRKSFRN